MATLRFRPAVWVMTSPEEIRMQENLEATVRRLNDVHEIQNVMGWYEYLTAANMFTAVGEQCFAKTVPQKVEIGPVGVWEGMDAGMRCFDGWHNWMSKTGVPLEGQLMEHHLTTPVIEVAKDGQTAKGVWMSPGHEARWMDGKLTAVWVWGHYGEDFIKEQGAWKIRNHHVYIRILTPYGVSWTAAPQKVDDILPPGLPDELKPDRPSTYPYIYTPDMIVELQPVPPLPHDTYDPSTDYIQ
jgi:hypothetical protein